MGEAIRTLHGLTADAHAGEGEEREDLETIRAIVGDARVVAIGEGAHNIDEFHQITDRIFRTLVEELGFSAFVMESGFPEALQVQEWIDDGARSLEAVSREGITYGFGDCDSVRGQLRWMRRRSHTGAGGVSFYGMDLGGCSTSPGPAVAACLARLPPRPGDAELRRRTDLGGRAQAAAHLARLTVDERAALGDELVELAERAEAMAAGRDGVLGRCAAAVRAFIADVAQPASAVSVREAFMADTVRWILEREPRIVINAHNAHVRRNHPGTAPVLGSLLASSLGSDYVAIATTYGAGPELRIRERTPRPYDWEVSLGRRVPAPRTVEAMLDGLDARTPVIDLRRAPDGMLDEVTGTLENGEVEAVDDFALAYDALIHLRQVTHVPGAFDRLRADLAAADWPQARSEALTESHVR